MATEAAACFKNATAAAGVYFDSDDRIWSPESIRWPFQIIIRGPEISRLYDAFSISGFSSIQSRSIIRSIKKRRFATTEDGEAAVVVVVVTYPCRRQWLDELSTVLLPLKEDDSDGSSWNLLKKRVEMVAIHLQVDQHPMFAAHLVLSDHAFITYKNPSDLEWGSDVGGLGGRNLEGQALMSVRRQLSRTTQKAALLLQQPSKSAGGGGGGNLIFVREGLVATDLNCNLFGGKRDGEETIRETAIREFQEESSNFIRDCGLVESWLLSSKNVLGYVRVRNRESMMGVFHIRLSQELDVPGLDAHLKLVQNGETFGAVELPTPLCAANHPEHHISSRAMQAVSKFQLDK